MSTAKPIAELTPNQALQRAVKASELLLVELNKNNNTADELETTLSKIEKLQTLRDQLIHQVFSELWSEAQVAQQAADFAKLDTLDKQLQKLAKTLRTNLHQLRTDNQQGRKAISAYGKAKGQFLR
ncbi:MAG TPA: hypothetical protein VJY63_09065 [Marinospirillum sp.]|uniref:hypothetical protein n=1 Tax=Marinospirillum sp. TaxID=2183934 RepID=UPI002B48DEDE|nr:hypothetical protein [Marinospirillum sp.]HKM16051.1 hypothetical protein [Marinospirillum sp.]